MDSIVAAIVANEALSIFHYAKLNAKQAIDIALADTPGTIIDAELEMDDRVLVWETLVLTEKNKVYEFDISANDSSIMEKELELR